MEPKLNFYHLTGIGHNGQNDQNELDNMFEESEEDS